ncbi:MAG TPA: CopD family protein, partial [Sinorhizobium sp.]|nr:CopD family protein [Sinorhizobium sp.]
NPAMIATWIFGLLLLSAQDLGQGWLQAKLGLVAAMTWLHHIFARWRKDFAADRNARSRRFYRFANEAPTLLLIAIVILVVVKPF